MRPAEAVEGSARAEARYVEPAEHVVEHAIHLAMKRKQGMQVVLSRQGNISIFIPGNEVSHGHGCQLHRFCPFCLKVLGASARDARELHRVAPKDGRSPSAPG